MKAAAKIRTILWTALFTCLVPILHAQEKENKPNFVLILIDDMPWYGTPIQMIDGEAMSSLSFREMPHLESFAAQSMRFSHAYAPAPICGPSRCSIQTGQTGITSGITMNGGGADRDKNIYDTRSRYDYMKNKIPISQGGLKPESITIAEALKPLGYKSAHFGKWHSFGGGPGAQGYDAHDGNTENNAGSPGEEGNPKRIFGITKRSIDFMETQVTAGQPFYVQLSHYANHARSEYTAESFKRFENMRILKSAKDKAGKKNAHQWAAMSFDLDRSIGQVLDSIDALGISDHTYVIITSDNGHTRWNQDRKMLRGEKWTLWETGIRVPMWVRGPGIAANSLSSELVCGTDFLPTFVELAGGDIDTFQNLDGGSLVNHLKSEGSQPVERAAEGLYFHYPHYRNSEPMSVLIQGGYKLLHFYDHPDEPVLIHLDSDVGEQKNLASKQPKKALSMQKTLLAHLKQKGARMPVPNENFDPQKIDENAKKVYGP